MTGLLDIKNLTVRFDTDEGRVAAVNGVSYELRQGEVLGVVGESGSGKSVHALAIMRLVPQPYGRIEQGRIRFRGRDLLALSDRDMRGVRGREIAMIFQDPISSLNPVYTVGFQVKETLRAHLDISRRAAAARAAELLDMVGIADARQRLGSYPHELSGGMRQRVMIAMALACSPKILIADEPTTALDVTIQAQIIDLIKRLQADLDLTVIWISHDLGIVAGLAQTVNVMYAGSVIERGPVGDIFKRPLHPYTVGLLNSIPRLDRGPGAKLEPIPGRPPNLARLGPGCPFAPRCALADPTCRTEMPPVAGPRQGGHTVRCWKWQSVTAEGRAHV
jgi:oligopeptide/dipeptide ABC transporter ATP-binding protein